MKQAEFQGRLNPCRRGAKAIFQAVRILLGRGGPAGTGRFSPWGGAVVQHRVSFSEGGKTENKVSFKLDSPEVRLQLYLPMEKIPDEITLDLKAAKADCYSKSLQKR